MADSTILKEFLVSLGWKIDEAGMRRFGDGLTQVDHKIRNFGLAIGGMAVLVEESIRRLTRQFDNLYYISQRTETPVRSIMALRHAFSQVGLQASDADQMLNSFAATVRDNPGLKNYADSISGGFKDASDFIIKVTKQYDEILKKYGAAAPEARTFRIWMETLGLNAEHFHQLGLNADVAAKSIAHTNEILSKFHTDEQDASKLAVGSTRAWNEFWLVVNTALDVFIVKTFPTITKLVTKLGEILIANAGSINQAADDFGKWVQSEEGIKNITNAMEKMNEFLQGIKTSIEYIWDFFKWVTSHPELAGAAAGGVAGGITGGPWGAFIGAILGHDLGASTQPPKESKPFLPDMERSQGALEKLYRKYTDPVLRAPDEAAPPPLPPGTPGAKKIAYGDGGNTGFDLDPLQRLILMFSRWWDGDSTFHPLVDFAAIVYGKFADMLREVFNLKRDEPEATGASVGGGGVPRTGGRFGGMSPGAGKLSDAEQVKAGRLTMTQIRQYALDAGFKGADADMMAAIAMGESKGDPYAKGDPQYGGSYGITQINRKSHGDVALSALGDPRRAMELAYQISKGGTDFTPWSVYKSGAYKQYMDRPGAGGGASAGGLKPEFAANLERAFEAAKKATGEQLRISSGHRTREQQERSWLASDRSGHWVARPGHSMHEKGMAADLGPRASKALQWLHENAKEFGLHFPMSWEKWHIEPLGSRDRNRNTNIDSDHNVNINLHGSDNQHAAARAIQDVQERQSALHMRNLRTAVA